MQAGGNITLDANAQHPPEIRPDDPRHLGNLTKKMGSINAQVSSDTKYDPNPPPRVDIRGNPVTETFESELPISEAELSSEFLYAVGATALAVIVVVVVIIIDPALRRTFSQIQYSYYLLASTSILAMVTIYICKEAIHKNEIINWYPPMRG